MVDSSYRGSGINVEDLSYASASDTSSGVHVGVQKEKCGSIIFAFEDKEILRIDPGTPPRITVAEGVETSEAAALVLAALAPMIGRYFPHWK